MIPEQIQNDIDKLARIYPLESRDEDPIIVIIKDFELPQGYKKDKADLLIIIPIAYPNAGLDMFWVENDAIPNNKTWPFVVKIEEIAGRTWFRFSWHGQWTPGVDNLLSFLEFICVGLKRALQ
jgi:hypothetical protein